MIGCWDRIKGCCYSNRDSDQLLKNEQANSKDIDRANEKQALQDQKIIKLLLLGAGESGKSTLFKQMINIYGAGFTHEERQTYKPIIGQNTLIAIKTLIQASRDLQEKHKIDAKIDDSIRDICDEIEILSLDTIIDQEIAKKIKIIWKDTGIQLAHENRSLFQFPDSAPYFFGRINDIASDSYSPSNQDILRSRVRTTGIVETNFEVEGGQKFNMFDVGGQRNERKKWIHCFEYVTCVIFVAAINEYDQVLYEDESTNRMDEALKLFDEICNAKWFVETSLILFLNKKDLFEEKIKQVPLTVQFPEYDGDPNDLEECSSFLRQKFESLNRVAGKEIYTHITCATDTDNIKKVFECVKETLIKKSLRDGGFM